MVFVRNYSKEVKSPWLFSSKMHHELKFKKKDMLRTKMKVTFKYCIDRGKWLHNYPHFTNLFPKHKKRPLNISRRSTKKRTF